MNKKVKTEKFGIVHGYAQCHDCEWNEGIDTSTTKRMEKLRSKIYSHVKSTGHTVCLETGSSFYYSLEN